MSEGETVCEYNEREACRVSGSERRGRQCGSIVREGVREGRQCASIVREEVGE